MSQSKCGSLRHSSRISVRAPGANHLSGPKETWDKSHSLPPGTSHPTPTSLAQRLGFCFPSPSFGFSSRYLGCSLPHGYTKPLLNLTLERSCPYFHSLCKAETVRSGARFPVANGNWLQQPTLAWAMQTTVELTECPRSSGVFE